MKTCSSILCSFAITLLVLVWFASTATGNPAALAEFGSNRGKPIDGSFFFIAGQYIEAPYVVERRGLDVYINDLLVSPGPGWPPYNYVVKSDPGDPPAGSSPCDPIPHGIDPRDGYWPKKWRYLIGHNDADTAKKKKWLKHI